MRTYCINVNEIISGSDKCYKDNKKGDVVGSDLVGRENFSRWEKKGGDI